MTHQLLPKEEWTKPEDVRIPFGNGKTILLTSIQDKPYLSELITDIESEMAEREDLEALIITKRQRNANASSSH
jgi:ubiquinol-cytochrome c reductase subunit 7